MADASNAGADAGDFVITRTFEAPRDVVWKVWTEAKHLTQWWGPKGFTMNVATLDFRPGGIFHYSMKTPDGPLMWGKFAYREIAKPERIVFTNSFSDADGNITRNPWSATWPLEVMNHQTFVEQDGKTVVTMRGSAFNASDEERKTFEAGRTSMQMGFKGTLDQLEAYLATL